MCSASFLAMLPPRPLCQLPPQDNRDRRDVCFRFVRTVNMDNVLRSLHRLGTLPSLRFLLMGHGHLASPTPHFLGSG